MAVVADHGRIHLLPPGFDCFPRQVGGNEPIAAADLVRAASTDESLADLEIVLRLEERHQRPLEPAVAEVPGDLDRLLRERVGPRVIYTGGDVGRHIPYHIPADSGRLLQLRECPE